MHTEETIGCLGLLLFVAAIFGGVYLLGSRNAIKPDEMIPRFAELAQVDPDSVEIVRNSNPNFITGDWHDVTFELRISGEPKSGRCSSDLFSPIICRLYEVD